MQLTTTRFIHLALILATAFLSLQEHTVHAAKTNIISALNDRDILIHVWPATGERMTVYGRLDNPKSLNGFVPLDSRKLPLDVKAAQLVYGHEALVCSFSGRVGRHPQRISREFGHSKTRVYFRPVVTGALWINCMVQS